MKDQKIVEPLLGADPAIGRWLWAMQDARRRTMEELERVTPGMVDWKPVDHPTSIGSVLYHIAAIEADWLFSEVLEREFTQQIAALFPHEIREKTGRLNQVTGETLNQHLERLETVRSTVLDAYRRMDPADFCRARALPEYDVTPEWVLHHLMQHEAEHRNEIGRLRLSFVSATPEGSN